MDLPHAQREQVQRTYRDYIQGLFYAYQTEPRLSALRDRVSQFGYCADEFTDNGGWPHQFYVRVGRRMVGQYVMNENDVMQNGRRPKIEDPVALGTYSLAAHHHRYLAAPAEWPNGQKKDAVMLEGLLIGRIPNDAPYPISSPVADAPRDRRAQSPESGHPVGNTCRVQRHPHGADLHDAGRSGWCRCRAQRGVEGQCAVGELSEPASTIGRGPAATRVTAQPCNRRRSSCTRRHQRRWRRSANVSVRA